MEETIIIIDSGLAPEVKQALIADETSEKSWKEIQLTDEYKEYKKWLAKSDVQIVNEQVPDMINGVKDGTEKKNNPLSEAPAELLVNRYDAIAILKEQQQNKDCEAAHSIADDTLCALLHALEYDDVVDEYNKVDRSI